MIRLLFVVLFLTSLTVLTYAQVQSNGTGGGNWSDPGTWQGGIVPDFNSAAIQILSGDVVNVDVDFTIDETIIDNGATLIVDPGVVLTINNGAGTDLTVTGDLQVEGEFVLANGSTHAGMTAANTSFLAGSVYRHQFTTAQGVIPLADWDVDSEVIIEGYTSFGTGSAAGNWSQNFGNFTWNCTNQTGNPNLAGFLNTIQSNFEILSTGTGIFQLSTNQNPTIVIGGNFNIEGTSRLTVSTTGTSTSVSVGGNFVFNSTNSTGFGSRLVTTGTCLINIIGDFLMNAPGGQLTLANGTNGVGSIIIGGDFSLIDGTITRTGGGGARGDIWFSGTDATHNFLNTGTISSVINYLIQVSNTVIAIGESQFRGSAASAITVDGTLVVQSENPAGAITTGANDGAGNIRVGNRFYNPGSIVIYGGSGPQFMGNGQPTVADMTTVINNPAGVTQATTTLVINGNVTLENGDLNIPNNNLTINGETDLQLGSINFSTIGTARTLTLNGNVNLGDEIVVTSGTANANLIFGAEIMGGSTVTFSGANCNLTINGDGDLGIDFPIPGPTTLETVTINRTGNGTIVFGEDLLVTDDVTITAGAMRMNGSLTVNDDLNLDTGTTLFFEGQTLELRSQFNNNLTGGLLSSDAGSTLNILGTGILGTLEFSPSGNSLGTFLINRSTGGTLVTLNSPLTVQNSLTLRDGDFLNTSGLSFANGAAVIRYTDAAFVAGSAAPAGGPYDLFYETDGTPAGLTTGVEAQVSLSNLTSNVSGIITVSSAISVANTLAINSGTFTCGANAISTDILSLSGILNAPTSILTLTGNFINNGTFNRNTGTVQFNGNTSIGGLNNPSFQNVVINGVLTPPATFNIHGSFTNNGLFNNGGAGTVAFIGTAGNPQVVSGSAVTNFHNISVTNTSAVPDVIIESNQNITGVLTLAAAATFDADGAGNNRIFTLISANDDPTQDAAIAPFPNAAAQVQGNVTVQRFMSLEGTNDRIYRYISSPVQNATVADIQNEIPVTGSFTGSSVCSGCLTNASMFRYDETVTTGGIDDGYVAFPVASNAETLTSGRGYAIFVRGNIEPFLSAGSALWNVRGPVNRDNINYGVSFTSSGVPANDGWNLVGNPYPSTIDWDAATGWTRSNVSGTIYTRNNATGQYATYTSGSGGTNGGSQYIAMGQGFWVQATGGGANMVSNEQVKAAGTQTTFFRERSEYNILKFALTNGTIRDEAIIHFRDDATDGFDYHADGWKLPNATINLSSVVDGVGKFAINSFGDFNCTKTIALDVAGVAPGSYAFDFSSVDTFEPYIGLTLVDNFNGAEVDLRTVSTYTFQVTADALSFGDSRFAIRFSGAEVRNDFVIESSNEICSNSDLELVINNSQEDVTYQVFNGSVAISPGVLGNGETVQVTVPASALTVGTSNLNLKGSLPGCAVQKIVPVTVMETYQVTSVQDAERCLTGSVELSVSGTNDGEVLWYDAADASVPVGTGVEFQTPELAASKTYYATVVNSLGCEGARVPVQAFIHQFDLASIQHEGNMLISNYTTGNQWLFNGVEIPGATNQYYHAEESGLYSVNVSTTGGCITEDDIQFVFTATETSVDPTLKVYPNPTHGKLRVEVESVGPVSVRAMDITGKEQAASILKGSGAIKSGEIDLTANADGIYILHIQKGDSVHQVKIIKTNK